MQDNQDAAQNKQAPETNPPVAAVTAKEKMSKKQIIGMTILSLIAVAGVAFGIFGMTDSNNKNQEIERLRVQITEDTGEKTELETDKITITDPDGTTTEITDTIAPTVNTSDYIYIGEWGIKIKIPDNIQRISYSLNNFKDNSYGLYVSGVQKGTEELPDFADLSINTQGLGGIVRFKNDDEKAQYGQKVYSLDGYDYRYFGPQTYYSTSETDRNQETESTQLIQQMLTNSENYSKF